MIAILRWLRGASPPEADAPPEADGPPEAVVRAFVATLARLDRPAGAGR